MSEHSAKFQVVKDHYDNGRWNESMVKNAIGRWITEEEASEILSEDSSVDTVEGE